VGTNHISGTAEARIVKFCKQLDYIKSSIMDDKPSPKGAWPWPHDLFLFFMLAVISLEWLKRELPIFLCE